MPINTEELLSVAVKLAEERNLQVTITESGKGACIAGGGAFVGGLVGGPLGLAVGGTLGSIMAYWNGSGKFQSVAEVILSMSPQQRNDLVNSLQRALQDVALEDALLLTKLIMSNDALKILVVQEVCKFLKNEMKLNVIM